MSGRQTLRACQKCGLDVLVNATGELRAHRRHDGRAWVRCEGAAREIDRLRAAAATKDDLLAAVVAYFEDEDESALEAAARKAGWVPPPLPAPPPPPTPEEQARLDAASEEMFAGMRTVWTRGGTVHMHVDLIARQGLREGELVVDAMPDLLDVARELVSMSDGQVGNPWRPNEGGWSDASLDDLVETARAAIAKAEGRS